MANRIRDMIVENAGASVRRIVLYGSRVTGRARSSSDFDVLVVLEEPVPDSVRASLQLAKLFDSFAYPVDVQVIGETEYEECRPVAGTLAYTAEHYSIVLHARSE